MSVLDSSFFLHWLRTKWHFSGKCAKMWIFLCVWIIEMKNLKLSPLDYIPSWHSEHLPPDRWDKSRLAMTNYIHMSSSEKQIYWSVLWAAFKNASQSSTVSSKLKEAHFKEAAETHLKHFTPPGECDVKRRLYLPCSNQKVHAHACRARLVLLLCVSFQSIWMLHPHEIKDDGSIDW